jgi:hypothetical protein
MLAVYRNNYPKLSVSEVIDEFLNSYDPKFDEYLNEEEAIIAQKEEKKQ